jgi:heme-degrading monooxygenase HmoA
MAIEVFIRRKFIKEKADELAPLIVKLRSMATMQPGYISGETLKCIEPPDETDYLVISTWQSVEYWKKWLLSKERSIIQEKIDTITKEKTEYRIYEPLVGGIMPKIN